MPRLSLATALVLAAVTVAPAEPPKPAGMVLATKGVVTLDRSGQPKRLTPMALLYPGDQLTSGGGEAKLIFLADGHRERLKPKAAATVGEKGCNPDTAVEQQEVKSLPPVPLARLQELGRSERGGVSVGMFTGINSGTDRQMNSPHPMRPIQGGKILTDSPTFAWRVAAKAESYQVQLFSRNREQLLWKAATKESRLHYPENAKRLEPGKEYVCVVRARLSGGEVKTVGESTFSVLSKIKARQLEKVTPLSRSEDSADLLLAATIYEGYELFDEALALYERLASRLANEPNVQFALARCYKRAGLEEKATEAHDRAKRLEVTPLGQ